MIQIYVITFYGDRIKCLFLSRHRLSNLAESEVYFQLLFGCKIYIFAAQPLPYSILLLKCITCVKKVWKVCIFTFHVGVWLLSNCKGFFANKSRTLLRSSLRRSSVKKVVRKNVTNFFSIKPLFNKIAGLQDFNFTKIRLQHKCFPVKFATYLRTPILKNICQRLLLALSWINSCFPL